LAEECWGMLERGVEVGWNNHFWKLFLEILIIFDE